MAMFLMLLAVIPKRAFCNPCNDESNAEIPNGISLFEQTFDLNENNELQLLRTEVLNNKCNFGISSLSSSLFSFADGYINLHSGSFGSAPKYVVKYHDHIRNILYSRPHLWDDVYSLYIMDILRQEMANYLGIDDMNDLVFTINTSHGINAIIKSLMDHFFAQYINKNNTYDISDYSIIYFNTAHGAYISPLKYYEKLYNINLIEIQFDEYILKDYKDIIATINNTLNDRIVDTETIIFAVFSHITSLPSMILPLADIVELFNKQNIITIIDGAHSMGQIYDLNITATNCDIYISNAYKWFYSVWNTAVIYVKKEYQNIINPPGMVYQNASFQKLFHHPGTVDESAYLSLMGSLEFRYLIGRDKNIINYIHKIAIDAQQYLSNLWNTTIFIPNNEYFSGMINVELPSIEGIELNKQKIDEIFFRILQEDDIAIKLFKWNNKFYIRISCQLYTNIQQIEKIGNLILKYLNDYYSLENNEILKEEL